jgi:endonuclease YncB( thermonuclease family)
LGAFSVEGSGLTRRSFRRSAVSFLLLAGLVALWLYPEGFGLGAMETRSATGDSIIVRDGDTLTIGALDHRLNGIDAPEYSQICKDEAGQDWPCGKEARTALAALVTGHSITCEERARDKYGRAVATCRDEQGRDLSRTMVERGLAVSFGGFAEGPYADEEADAKASKRGLWRGSFEMPSSWRAGHSRGKRGVP